MGPSGLAQPQVLVHGHTHAPRLQRRGWGLMICPGSIHRPKGDWPCRTVGLVHVEDGGRLASAEIVKI